MYINEDNTIKIYFSIALHGEEDKKYLLTMISNTIVNVIIKISAKKKKENVVVKVSKKGSKVK